jgi:predicted nuclease of predicted toxin-antitoxin system
VKFKLDENLSPSLATILTTAGHDAHSIVEQNLGGASDAAVLTRCTAESRALITCDLDFANIHAYPPGRHAGIVVLRLGTQAQDTVAAALARVVALVATERLAGCLWIAEDSRIRIHEEPG